jgi:hypothetical protein
MGRLSVASLSRRRTPTGRTQQRRVAGARNFLAQFYNRLNVAIERVFSVGLVKSTKTVCPRGYQSQRAELAQFVLDGVKRQVRLQSQFANVILGSGQAERSRKSSPLTAGNNTSKTDRFVPTPTSILLTA